MNRWDFFDREYFPPSRPREAKGGIRAQSKRGEFGQSWWAKRWIAVLEGFNIGARLQRGRSYARSGQVLSLEIGKGEITAKVQGSRPAPYSIRIGVRTLPRTIWTKLAEAASSQAVYASKLLAGQMPDDMEDLFAANSVSLFPTRHNDLQTHCSCPDASNPCKHIAAVYYLLGEEFDRDPFLIFRMRGTSREEFMALLGEAGVAALDSPPPEPLPLMPSEFWKSKPIPEGLAGDVPQTSSGAALPRRLGKFPFWRGTQDLLAFLDQVYEACLSGPAVRFEPAPEAPASEPAGAAKAGRQSAPRRASRGGPSSR